MLSKLLQGFLPENSRQYREETSQRIVWGHWFALFNIVLAILIGARYAFNADWPDTLFGKLYFFISLFGHFSFVIVVPYLLILFPLSFVIKNHRAYRGIAVIVATIGLTILLVDSEIFKRFYLHLSPLVWDLLVNPDDAELSRHWQLLFVPMPIILLLEMLYSRWCWNKLRSFNRQKWGKYVALFFLICFSATHILYAWADMALYRPITAQKANYPLSYPMTARTLLEKHGLINRSDLVQTIEQNGRLDTFFLDYPKHHLQFTAPQNTINLLIINLSGLTAQDIGAETMPNLAHIRQQSRFFSNHYSGGDTASAGIASLFYGLSGRYVDAILNEKQPALLISRLQQLNYRFGLFSHNGFAEPIYRQALFSDFKLPNAQSNSQAVQLWQNWLAKHGEAPFFSYLDLQKSQSNLPLDQQLGKIWQTLTEQNRLTNTLVLITADIGQPSHSQNSFAAESIKIPMIIYWQQETGTIEQLSSHLDVTPTLLSQFFGLHSAVEHYAQGINLALENHRKWLLASNYRWNVAILPNGEQYHIDRKGDFIRYTANNSPENHSRPPLALFLQLIQQSNQFIEN